MSAIQRLDKLFGFSKRKQERKEIGEAIEEFGKRCHLATTLDDVSALLDECQCMALREDTMFTRYAKDLHEFEWFLHGKYQAFMLIGKASS